MRQLEALMQWPLVYRLWMQPHAERKMVPITTHNDISNVRRVLDVGCGPGTDAPYFSHADYLGIDWNERYIREARKRYGDRFETGDVKTLRVASDARFDFILVNSLLHHLDLSSTHTLLSHFPPLLADGGHVHIIELVLPARVSLPFLLARCDRGDHPRPIDEWHEIFNEHFDEVVFEPFDLPVYGVIFWNMVYFKGRARTGM